MFVTVNSNMINVVTQVIRSNLSKSEHMILNGSFSEKWYLSGQNIIMSSSTVPWSKAAVKKQIVDFTNSLFADEWPNGKYYNWMDAIYGNYTKSSAQE